MVDIDLPRRTSPTLSNAGPAAALRRKVVVSVRTLRSGAGLGAANGQCAHVAAVDADEGRPPVVQLDLEHPGPLGHRDQRRRAGEVAADGLGAEFNHATDTAMVEFDDATHVASVT